MKKLLVLFLIISFGATHFISAATIIAEYQGGEAPSTSTWSNSGNSTFVTAQSATVGGVAVWQISDPGTAAIAGVTSANKWYKHSVHPAWRSDMTTKGWEANLSLMIPDLSEIPATEEWAVGSNTWISVSMLNSNGGNSTYALMFGRDTSGLGILQGYNNSGTKTITAGFHDYRLVYDPSVSVNSAAVYVDGELWKFITPSVNLTGTTAEIVWGDNLSQSGAIKARSAYYSYVSMAIVPEPVKGLLLFASGLALMLQRRRN